MLLTKFIYNYIYINLIFKYFTTKFMQYKSIDS